MPSPRPSPAPSGMPRPQYANMAMNIGTRVSFRRAAAGRQHLDAIRELEGGSVRSSVEARPATARSLV